MRSSSLVSLSLSATIAAVLTGCSGGSPGTPPLPISPGTIKQASVTEHVLHSFSGYPSDGQYPTAPVINLDGTLYGTTSFGGTNNQGTVFTLTASGTETPIHSFNGYPYDGSAPNAIIAVNGTLYGTTSCNGSYGYGGGGVVFSLTKRGQERVLYSFPGSDCSGPYAGLTDVKGTLYGTTLYLGQDIAGTVFSVTTSGNENTIYQFNGTDGAYPMASLLNIKGRLFGTTTAGGVECGTVGCGTVFKVTTAGKEEVLYRFKGASDGSYPAAGVIPLNRALYGTTEYDGIVGGNCGVYGCGTVFKITTSKETVLHRFSASPDGANPMAGLLNVNGTLYGTTSSGGANGAGTVFRITPSGKVSIVYSFAGGPNDGASPQAGLIAINGTLYGTTYSGGTYGYGTVFALKLSSP